MTPGLGSSPGGGHGNLLQWACLENLQGQRSLVGYSPWSCKKSDMTERLSTAQQQITNYLVLKENFDMELYLVNQSNELIIETPNFHPKGF